MGSENLNGIDYTVEYTSAYIQRNDVCRICLTTNALFEIITENNDIEKSETQHVSARQISYCLDIHVTLEEEPNKVCQSCFDSVVKFCWFKRFCHKRNEILKEIIQYGTTNSGRPLLVKEERILTKLEKDNTYNDVELNPAFGSIADVNYLDEELENKYDSDSMSESVPLISLARQKVNRKKHANKMKIAKTNNKQTRPPNFCNMCNLYVESKEKNIEHKNNNHNTEKKRLFKCYGCDKKYKRSQVRNVHEVKFCKNTREGYRCPACSRNLPSRKFLYAHLHDHNHNVPLKVEEYVFACNKCNKSFSTMVQLEEHEYIMKHNRKEYICETCGRVFARHDYLHKHKATHTGSKMYSCPHCDYKATQKTALTVHLRKHTGERPYACAMCPQRCVSASNLRSHARTHLALKLHQCSVCGKSFGYKASLDEHTLSKHAAAPRHACELCPAVYSRQRGLRRHLLAKHGDSVAVEVAVPPGDAIRPKPGRPSTSTVTYKVAPSVAE